MSNIVPPTNSLTDDISANSVLFADSPKANPSSAISFALIFVIAIRNKMISRIFFIVIFGLCFICKLLLSDKS